MLRNVTVIQTTGGYLVSCEAASGRVVQSCVKESTARSLANRLQRAKRMSGLDWIDGRPYGL